MANKRHRLLHTLVFSSVLAAGGCGAASPAPLEPAPIAANEYTAETEASTPEAPPTHGAPPGVQTPPAQTQPYADRTESAAVADRRYCEPGWPTTKGSRCEPEVNAEGETETVCCGTYPLAEDAVYDADNHRCCVQAS